MHLRHTLPPFDTFRLAVDTTHVDSVSSRCEGIQDTYTKGFIKYWSANGGIDCFGGRTELAIQIILGRTNSCRIESINALLRRMAVVRTQTQTMLVEDLSAKIVLSRLKLRCQSLHKPRGIAAQVGKKRRQRKHTKNKKDTK